MRKPGLLIAFLSIGLLTISSTLNTKPTLKSAMKALEGFCNYIPSGSVVVEQDTITVQSFYMSETEITNFQYAEFLYDLKKRGESDKYAVAAINNDRWNTAFNSSSLEPMADYYHDHPAYQGYPVVNVSKAGAELYCEWLSAQYDSLSNGDLKLKFRVPTRAEWIRAANGDLNNSAYSWGGTELKDAKGICLANYLKLGAQNITRNEESGEYQIVWSVNSSTGDADLTAPAKSYFPNDYGLYNMNGNVAEMVSDGDLAVGGDWNSPGYDIRNQSVKKFEETHPTVGFRIVATYLARTE
ncbi:MAG: sulfatase modifying factor 1 [Flavobacteriaceae bacterium]|jgi:sulfatase modifying factor 1